MFWVDLYKSLWCSLPQIQLTQSPLVLCTLSLSKPFKVNAHLTCSCIRTLRMQIPTAVLPGILASDFMFVAFFTQTM